MDDLWKDRTKWPLILDEDEHEFFAAAFNRIGRRLFGEKWHDDSAGLVLRPVKASNPDDADALERERAHALLTSHWPGYLATYRKSFENPAYAGLGQSFLGQHAAQPDRSGWQFTREGWDHYRKIVADMEAEKAGELALVAEAAKWLLLRIVRGRITPLAQHKARGGAYEPTAQDDWRMPRLEYLLARVRSCAMQPGYPHSPGGQYWIVFRRVEIDAALEADRPASLEQGEPAHTHDKGAELTQAEKNSLFVKNTPAMKARCRELIEASGRYTRGAEVVATICAEFPNSAADTVHSRIWGPVASEYDARNPDWKLRRRGRKPKAPQASEIAR